MLTLIFWLFSFTSTGFTDTAKSNQETPLSEEKTLKAVSSSEEKKKSKPSSEETSLTLTEEKKKTLSLPETEKEEESPQTQKKKWSLSFSHAVQMRGAVGSRDVLINGVSGQYTHSKKLSFSSSVSYLIPLGNVSDASPYGFTDTSFSMPFSLPFPKGFWAKSWSGSTGISIPTSYKARKKSKWFSLFGRILHNIKKERSYKWAGEHVLYASFYKYLSNISGSQPNPFAYSSHSLIFSYKYKRLSFAATGKLYFSASLRNKSAGSFWKRINLRNGGQGIRFTLSYTVPKPKIDVFGQTGVGIPFVDPVLTGFSLGEKYWTHLLGIGWKI